MSNCLRLFLFLVLAGVIASAGAITVTLIPPSAPVSAGATISTDVNIAGLSNPPSVGAFDLTISYDPSLLTFTGVTFGVKLGDPALARSPYLVQPVAWLSRVRRGVPSFTV